MRRPVGGDGASPASGVGSGEVALSWTAPVANGGSAITDYVVEYSTNGGSSWSTFADGTSTVTSATVTGLTNGDGVHVPGVGGQRRGHRGGVGDDVGDAAHGARCADRL